MIIAFIISAILNIILIIVCKESYKENKHIETEYNRVIDQRSRKIYNLFWEIKKDYSSSGYTTYYKGVIKTLEPESGKEIVIWESEDWYKNNKEQCEEDTKKRYKFLCDYYSKKFNEKIGEEEYEADTTEV